MLAARARLAVLAAGFALAALALGARAQAAPPADSAILFIGDGMGPVHLQLAREAAGGALAMEGMPVSGVVSTKAAGDRTTDSAAAATALATGEKTDNGMIGLAPDRRRLRTILELCKSEGKSTGIVTTDALHGATPASFAAHVGDRGMRSEIALQMAESGVPVMLGFSREYFLPKSAGGRRSDGRNLIAEMRRAGYRVAFSRHELSEAEGSRLLGLFDGGAGAPALAEMVTAALERMGADPDGFFLVVEGASIDWKAHEHDPAGVALDGAELDSAVAAALDFARRRGRTLVLATADHETGGLSIRDPGRLGVIRGVSLPAGALAAKLNRQRSNIEEVLSAHAGMEDLSEAEVGEIRDADSASAAIAALISKRAGLGWSTVGHTSTLVPLFAFGPGAEQFSGEMDNTDIPKRMARALDVGPLPQ